MYNAKLPRYQCTARDVRTGGQWISSGKSKETTDAATFARYLLSQLTHYGVDLSEVIIQTDNGSEFIGSVQKRKEESAFIKVLEDAGVKEARIPPRACTWQSDVEASHKMIEDEFYDIEVWVNLRQRPILTGFRSKDGYKGRKAPIQMLKEAGSSISPQVSSCDFTEFSLRSRGRWMPCGVIKHAKLTLIANITSTVSPTGQAAGWLYAYYSSSLDSGQVFLFAGEY